jgi:hypothetical protein
MHCIQCLQFEFELLCRHSLAVLTLQLLPLSVVLLLLLALLRHSNCCDSSA